MRVGAARRTARHAAAATWAACLAACGNGGGDTPLPGAETPEGQEATVPVGTFASDVVAAGEAPHGRLPAEGDLSIYVPATSLFPGTARIDPAIQNPYADAEAIAAGERHFAAFNCAGCHAPLGGGGMGPPLSDDEWIHGSEPAQIYLSIMHGRSDGMPAWSSMLPSRTAWELVAYIETLDEIEDHAARKGFDAGTDRFAGVEPGDLPWLRNARDGDTARQ